MKCHCFRDCNDFNYLCASSSLESTFDRCSGYSEERVQKGWFPDGQHHFSLGDLKTEDPIVSGVLIAAVQKTVREHNIDALRLDAAPYMPPSFVEKLRRAVGIEVLGEVNDNYLLSEAACSRALVHLLPSLLCCKCCRHVA